MVNTSSSLGDYNMKVKNNEHIVSLALFSFKYKYLYVYVETFPISGGNISGQTAERGRAETKLLI